MLMSNDVLPKSNVCVKIESVFFIKLWFALRRGMFIAFVVGYNVGLTGIKLKRY